MELLAVLPMLPSLFLHVVRASGFLFGSTLFGTQGSSRMPRLMLAVSLGVLLWWVGDKRMGTVESLTEFALLAAREAFLGLLLGFAVNLLSAVVITAGEIISHEMGFGMARIVDPSTGRNSPVVSQLFTAFAVLLMFHLNVHHEALRMLAATYEAIPVGRPFDLTPVAGRLQESIGEALVFALRYAAPVLGVMVLVTATLVVLARAVPNINLMEFTFGVRILLALLGAYYFLAEGMPFLGGVFERLLGHARGLLSGA